MPMANNIVMENEGSKRVSDVNGWYEIKNNPLSKVGVFPYLGKSLGPEYMADQIYQVYRPASELSNSECINSFKLVPWVNDHTMLGASAEGLTPVEQKGAEGVIGEEVYFNNDILYGNIKVWSEQLADIINSGKRELSCGYRCLYKKEAGVYNGVNYDAIQYNIRGNHLALVDEGRMGKEVAVMDSLKFTIDSTEIVKMAEKDKAAEPTVSELMGHIKTLADGMGALKGTVDKMVADKQCEMDAKAAADKKMADDAKAAADKKAKDDDMEGEEGMDKKGKDKKEGMDAKEIAKFVGDSLDTRFEDFKKQFLSEGTERVEIANKLSSVIGTFDHSGKSLKEIETYGVEKLGIKCEKGAEKAALLGFFFAKDAMDKNGADTGFALDTTDDADKLDANSLIKH